MKLFILSEMTKLFSQMFLVKKAVYCVLALSCKILENFIYIKNTIQIKYLFSVLIL